jgi:hypothetical protein
MKLAIGSLAVMMAGVLTTATAVRAQTPAPPPTIISIGAPSSDLPLADYQAFEKFAAGHPEIINDLSRDPRLVEDRDYLAGHPDLSGFLATHAELKDSLIANPGNFIVPRVRRHRR